jgi:hypothetical protein
MGRPSRMMESLVARMDRELSREFDSDEFEEQVPRTPEEELEQHRSELRAGLTDMQRLFLFGKLSGLNDKDAALAAGYSPSVAENTKQRIWKEQVRAEYDRVTAQLNAQTESRIKKKPCSAVCGLRGWVDHRFVQR